MYTKEQMRVLSVRPGITDPASIKYRNENELLSQVDNPEQYYIENIMPDKISLNLQYIESRSLFGDIRLIFKTIFC
jgi:lipopolysaccharide/colanic/teichoic acid biosynthesis glycosyltransferase